MIDSDDYECDDGHQEKQTITTRTLNSAFINDSADSPIFPGRYLRTRPKNHYWRNEVNCLTCYKILNWYRKNHSHKLLGPILQTYDYEINDKRGLDSKLDHEEQDAWLTICFGGVQNCRQQMNFEKKETGEIIQCHCRKVHSILDQQEIEYKSRRLCL